MTAKEGGLLDYTYANERIKEFAEAEVGWDGFGGLPASPGTVADVEKFLPVAQHAQIKVPGLAMGGDGSVAVIWRNEDVYISVEFDGTGSYTFLVCKGDELLRSGHEDADRIAVDLHPCLVAYFGREDCWKKV